MKIAEYKQIGTHTEVRRKWIEPTYGYDSEGKQTHMITDGLWLEEEVEVPTMGTVYREATEEELASLNQPIPREVEIEQIHKALEDTDYKWGKWLEESTLGLPLSYTMEEIHEEKQMLRDRLHELGED